MVALGVWRLQKTRFGSSREEYDFELDYNSNSFVDRAQS
eukprot:gene3701-14262_t